MPRDYYPRRESDILVFTSNFSAKINQDPQVYGLSPQQASDYAQLASDFAQLYSTCNNHGGNCSENFMAKETARIALENATRPLVGTIKAYDSVTDAMRSELGIPARPVRRRHIARPEAAPNVRVLGWSGMSVTIRLSDAQTLRPGKPRDVSGALIFTYIGENPPTRMDQWTFKANTTRSVNELRFDGAEPGTKIWFTACWHNPRQETGPWSNSASTHVPFDAIATPQTLRKAA